jgi:ABC-2 family transporter protein
MIWLTWRQARAQLVTVSVLVLAVTITLAVTGPRLADLSGTANLYDLLTGSDRLQFYGGLAVLAAIPALLGAFWGAPLVARELESGTYRLVWNQTVTRTRWLAVKLVGATLATVVAVGVLTLAITWWAAPLDGTLGSTRGSLPSRLTPISFAMRGVVPVGYAVFALVLGVAVGLVLRRTVPAMAVTLAIYVLVQIAVPLWVRPHLIPPLSATIVLSQSTLDGIAASPGAPLRITAHTENRDDWILTNTTIDAQGRTTSLPTWFTACLPDPSPAGSGKAQQAAPATFGGLESCLTRLAAQGYRQWVAYQPPSRFWPLQWVETGLYLGLAGLLGGACFWWTRRRLS